MVGRGFEQREDSYSDTYASVARMTSALAFISYMLKHGYSINQWDVTTAFLYGELKDKLYMEQPEGFHSKEKPPQQYVCQLKKGLYGLKQGARCWQDTLKARLRTLGFKELKADSNIYRKVIIDSRTGYQRNVYLLCYTDDILCCADSDADKALVFKQLNETFKVKDNGRL